ncbi:hypothetical protein [Methylocapsa sp. S129]|uniref:hypothetical protein n=1 Tax=Methylocapsa sp. S129 TaxID=1641869 RepID=UPI00131AE556|nr:hypothetical protein [Methylocapsa sp. S129]
MNTKWRILLAAALFSLGAIHRGQAHEPCPASPGVDQPGYLVEILLCTADSPRCKPDGTHVYKAGRGANPELEALSIQDIPDGDVITGGELFTSVYDMATRGFGAVNVAVHGGPGDYCHQHYWYDMRAAWTGDDASDKMTVEVCIHYNKWTGSLPIKPCAPPIGNEPQ